MFINGKQKILSQTLLDILDANKVFNRGESKTVFKLRSITGHFSGLSF